MARFPKARHDDQVDALSWLGLIVDQVQDADTPEEEDEFEYEKAKRQHQQDGRSQITGY